MVFTLMVWLGWAGGSGDVGRVCGICRLENWSDGGTERSNYGGGGGRVVADTGTQTSRTCWHPDHWVNTMLLWTCVAILWSYVLCYTDEMRVILLLMLRMYVILLPHDRLMYETMKLCLAVCIWWVTRRLHGPAFPPPQPRPGTHSLTNEHWRLPFGGDISF